MYSADTLEPSAAEAVRRLCGDAGAELLRLGGGRNSQVYRVSSAGAHPKVAKIYFRSREDERDRLGVEIRALTFLTSHGVRDVPRLLDHDREAGVVLLEYIEGTPAGLDDLSCNDADSLADFADRLRRLAGAAQGSEIGPASEACFSRQDILRAIERRVEVLTTATAEIAEGRTLREFLQTRFAPAFEHHRRTSAKRTRAAAQIPRSSWTLSPSDFGFHNAIRRSNGRLAFVDFEYFGWDDPVKMTADALLHPGAAPPSTVRSRLSKRLSAIFADVACFEDRLATMFPLVALNWTLILLNEFVPAHARRRGFAGAMDETSIRARQLARAEARLQALDRQAFLAHA